MNIKIINGKILFRDKFIKKDFILIGEEFSFNENIEADKVIDADGCYVLPGLIDIHTHLDDYIGKYYLADTYTSASEIALKNGFTTLFNFVTQKPGEELSDSIIRAKSKISDNIGVEFSFHLTPVNYDEDDFRKMIELINEGYKTFKFYTTYKKSGLYISYSNLENVYKRLSGYDIRFLIHCEDDDILKSAINPDFDYSDAYTHSLLRPKDAEVKAIEKVLGIAIKYKLPTHIVHISSVEGAKLVYEAKMKYDFISCETCPQYLLLDDDYLKNIDGYKYICSPPLRDKQNRKELSELANKGYFDIYTTDHCAFLKKDKDENRNDIRLVPNGLPGIGSLLYNIYNILEGDEETKLIHIGKRLSENPAKLMGIYPRYGCLEEGSYANLAIVNIGKSHPLKSTSQDVYDVYEEFSSNLNVRYTIARGRVYDFS